MIRYTFTSAKVMVYKVWSNNSDNSRIELTYHFVVSEESLNDAITLISKLVCFRDFKV